MKKLTDEQISDVCQGLVRLHGRKATYLMARDELFEKYGSKAGSNRLLAIMRYCKQRNSIDMHIGDIFSQAIPVPESGCWIWERAVADTGYGIIFRNGKLKSAHREAWESKNGPIPKGMYVCHKCDVRSCINPSHLFLGTSKENMKDCARKGRLNKNSLLNLLGGQRKTTPQLVPQTVVITVR